MKRTVTALLMATAFYFSSCTKTDTPVNLPVVVPKADSVTRGGHLNLSFAGKVFTINDLTVQKVPIYTLFSHTMASDENDTLWIAQIQMTDHQSKTISLNFTGYKLTGLGGTATGDYYIRDNSSTLTDYSDGENKVYAISLGSMININTVGYTTEGTMNLNLYWNNTYTTATGDFKIYY